MRCDKLSKKKVEHLNALRTFAWSTQKTKIIANESKKRRKKKKKKKTEEETAAMATTFQPFQNINQKWR